MAVGLLPLVYPGLVKRLSAVCNVFCNATSALYGLEDARYTYHIDW